MNRGMRRALGVRSIPRPRESSECLGTLKGHVDAIVLVVGNYLTFFLPIQQVAAGLNRYKLIPTLVLAYVLKLLDHSSGHRPCANAIY